MIISGRFVVPPQPQGVHGVVHGIKGIIAFERHDSVAVSVPTYVAANAAVAEASGRHTIIKS